MRRIKQSNYFRDNVYIYQDAVVFEVKRDKMLFKQGTKFCPLGL